MAPPVVPCPFCGSSDTEKRSDFGTSLMVRLHWCRRCRSSFEAIKWGDASTPLDLPSFLEERRDGFFPLPEDDRT